MIISQLQHAQGRHLHVVGALSAQAVQLTLCVQSSAYGACVLLTIITEDRGL